MRCPGQDPSNWKPEDVSEIKCPGCGEDVEFWKDEPSRQCRNCGALVCNSNIDIGCAKWCKFADKCGILKQGGGRDGKG